MLLSQGKVKLSASKSSSLHVMTSLILLVILLYTKAYLRLAKDELYQDFKELLWRYSVLLFPANALLEYLSEVLIALLAKKF